MTIQHPLPVDADSVPCRRDPERMFPSSNGARREAEDEAAKAVCRAGDEGRACPAINACLRYSLRYDVDGVWAGTTADERREIRDRSGVVPISIATTVMSRNAYRAAS